MPALGPAPYPEGKVAYPDYEPHFDIVCPGEVAVYRAYWNGIPAVTAKLEVTKHPEREGWICAGAKGSIFGHVAALYKARDSVHSCMNAESFKPDSYSVSINETLVKYNMVVDFNHEQETAFRRKVDKDGESTKDFTYTNAYCPVSTYLLIRSLPWEVGQKRRFEVIDGNDRYLLVIKADKEESVKVKTGTYDCVRFQTSIFEGPSDHTRESKHWWEKIKKKDEEKMHMIEEVHVWMAKDKPRHIIKAEADVFFGSVTLKLLELSEAEESM
ncbi:MAG: DUF3108 domain-containing protein [bacterium]